MDQAQLLTLKLQQGLWWGRKIIYLLVHRKGVMFWRLTTRDIHRKTCGWLGQIVYRNEGVWWHGKTFLYRQDLLRPHFWKSLSFQLHWIMAHMREKHMQHLCWWCRTYPPGNKHIPPLGKRKVIFKKCLCNGICSFPGGWVVPCPVHQQSPPVSEESTSHGYTIAVQHCHGDGQVAVDLLLAALADVWFIYLHLGSSGQFKGNKSIKNTMPWVSELYGCR